MVFLLVLLGRSVSCSWSSVLQKRISRKSGSFHGECGPIVCRGGRAGWSSRAHNRFGDSDRLHFEPGFLLGRTIAVRSRALRAPCHRDHLGPRSWPVSPPAERSPLIHDLGTSDDVVAVEAGGGETTVVGQDSEMGAGSKRSGAGSFDLSMLLRNRGEPQPGQRMLVVDSDDSAVSAVGIDVSRPRVLRQSEGAGIDDGSLALGCTLTTVASTENAISSRVQLPMADRKTSKKA